MFIGRDREMSEIEALLARYDDVQLQATLDGLPGIGKTELARQVVARLSRGKKFPGGIFWFAAEYSDLRMQWAKIAEELGAPVLHDLDERAAWAVKQIENRAQRGDQILIVLDNVETWAPPPAPLPDAAAIRLLVTTRTRWLHNSFRPYEVRPLEPAHARQLLDSIVGREVANSDDLIRVLGGHVLSIELAATYLREYGTPPDEYLRLLLAGKSPSSSVADQTSYRMTAESAFRLLWQRLTSDLRAGWHLAAYLPPVAFSTELADAIGLDAERRRGLFRLHILDRDDHGRHQMHRLLREFALAEGLDTPSVHDALIAGATRLLEDGDPLLRFQRYSRDAACFEHLLSTITDERPSLLRVASGIALQQLGDPQRARVLFEQALASNLKIYDENHPEVANSRSNLAAILRQLGDLPRARALFERALASELKTYGHDHPKVATTHANLAGLLRQLGDLREAQWHFERALASDIKTYGDDHLEVAITRANLAGLLQERGDRFAARAFYEQALVSHLKTYGESHPAVAAIFSNQARLLQELGDMPAARLLFERALASNLQAYDDDHPEVATSRANLAVLLQKLGELPAAYILFEQALASNIKIYGTQHPVVAITQANLARLLEKLGYLVAARTLHAKAFASDLKTYGANHPKVGRRRRNLVRLLFSYPSSYPSHPIPDSSEGTIYMDRPRPAPPEIPADSVLIDSAISRNPPGRRAIALLAKPYDAASDQALTSYLKRYGNVPKLTTDHAHLAGLRQVLGFPSSNESTSNSTDESTSNSTETGISLDIRAKPAVIAGIGGFVRRLLRRKPRE
jgi:tetratricopeptide (TPR) repeat protein